MANQHPYISAAGAISQAITQFRRSMPQRIDAATLQKLGLAPNNESYLINTLKFIKVINDEGGPTETAKKIFALHNDEDFSKGFRDLVKGGYQELFNLHAEGAWDLDLDKLTLLSA